MCDEDILKPFFYLLKIYSMKYLQSLYCTAAHWNILLLFNCNLASIDHYHVWLPMFYSVFLKASVLYSTTEVVVHCQSLGVWVISLSITISSSNCYKKAFIPFLVGWHSIVYWNILCHFFLSSSFLFPSFLSLRQGLSV